MLPVMLQVMLPVMLPEQINLLLSPLLNRLLPVGFKGGNMTAATIPRTQLPHVLLLQALLVPQHHRGGEPTIICKVRREGAEELWACILEKART